MITVIYIPKNGIISEFGNFSPNDFAYLLRKYKNDPDAIQFLADMMEE